MIPALDAFFSGATVKSDLREEIYRKTRLYITEIETLIASYRTVPTPALLEQFHYMYAVSDITMLVTN